MRTVDSSPDDPSSDPIDRLIISVRAYVTRAPTRPKKGKNSTRTDRRYFGPPGRLADRKPSSDWVLVFDCETRTTPDQRLRFGGYQLRYKGELFERGAFYEPDVLSADGSELALLRQMLADDEADSAGERVLLRTRADFVEKVFYERGYALGAQIVGFNLPFDLSRLAIRHASARRSMRGGFSLILSEERPHVTVKHLSQRAALIRFTGLRPPEKEEDEDIDPVAPHATEEETDPDRGYFVDVKTLAAALTSKSHSLASLSAILAVEHPKIDSDEHGGPLSRDYVRYALRDVQTTWECFDALARRFKTFGLSETGLYDLYSEASLGKAYLKAMKIKPWREVQPDFPPELIGNILSAYYGGRSEVHIRRQITPVIHCDFLSMYPTVCTLMGLWSFVRSTGVIPRNDTAAIRQLVEMPREALAARLRGKAGWKDLCVLVQVLPKHSLFPIRAEYPESDSANIGLNYLSGDQPQWFTLADVIASKILGNETPNVTAAIRFEPKAIQDALKPIDIAGQSIDPSIDDFYQRLIVHRNALKAKKLKTEEQGVKILANATSYGIFVELNVEDYKNAKPMIGHSAAPRPITFKSKKYEKPGRYFHPLLGTLITGAARLMLALAEHQVIEQGLDWAFCDTDSIAIANTNNLPLAEFKARALAVREWFEGLNPYGEDHSILQLEKVNFPVDKFGVLQALDPPECLAISAKRYVLFNRNAGSIIVRKASGHGLGHLMPPYDEPPVARRERIERIGVPLWQEDLWKEIIRAAESDTPDQTHFKDMPNFDVPAASQYAATTPELLRWFNGYNEAQPAGEKVFPFGFLLSLQAKSRMQMASDDPEALSHDLWRRRDPRPTAPYFKRPLDAKDHAFDRERGGERVPGSWLKSHGRSLARYHLHPETKFWGGEYDQRGTLQRRHVFALAHGLVGKEGDGVEENEFIGEGGGPLAFEIADDGRQGLKEHIFKIQARYDISDRELVDRAQVSHHSIAGLREGVRVSDEAFARLVRAAEALRQEAASIAVEKERWLDKLRELRDYVGGRNKLAKLLGISGPYLGRVLNEEKVISKKIIERVQKIFPRIN
jgi:hypothetical protein